MHVLTRCTSSAGDLDSTRLGLARLYCVPLDVAALDVAALDVAALDVAALDVAALDVASPRTASLRPSTPDSGRWSAILPRASSLPCVVSRVLVVFCVCV